MGELDRMAYEIAAKDAAWPVLPVIMADTSTGEILYVSKYAADIFGYDNGDLVGLPVEVLIPESVRLSHAKWRQDAAVPRTRLMGVGRQIHGVRKDGTKVPIHIGLTEMKVLGRQIGIAFVIDLTGIVEVLTPTTKTPSSHD